LIEAIRGSSAARDAPGRPMQASSANARKALRRLSRFDAGDGKKPA
jgi:hypothetical protein